MPFQDRPVVVGLEDKQPSALRFAVEEARLTRTGLRVVHSAGIPAQDVDFYIGLGNATLDELHRAGTAVLDRARQLIEDLDPTLDVQYVLSDRPPLTQLLKDSEDARSLIVGSDHVPWLERLMHTRIAGHLALHAACPVYVVPEQEFVAHDGPGHVVLALDGETSADGPLRCALEEANARDCPLHILHAVPPGTLQADVEAARVTIAEVMAGWRNLYPDVLVHEAVVMDAPERALERVAPGAALVVVGRPHHRSLPVTLARSVARAVLARASCPVVVVADETGR